MLKTIKHTCSSYWCQIRSVVATEIRNIVSDEGVVLVLVMASIIYATIYSLAYGPEVLHDVPIGVVDLSKTHASRQLTEAFDAGPNTVVAYEPEDMEAAKKLFFNRDIYGVVYIPEDYEEKLLGGSQAVVSLYVDASYFLMYRQVFQEAVAGINTTGAMVEFQRLIARGAETPQAKAITQPVIYQSHNLFNPYLGYGAFVMPAILVVILQQTMLIGVGMIGGTWREFGLYRKLIPPGETRMSTLPIVMGKSIVYLVVYVFLCLYLFALHYRLFHYPINGQTETVIALLIPYLLACTMLSIAVSTLFRYREQSLMFLLWSSIPILMVSGVSLPEQAIPGWLYDFGQLFPSSSGIRAFIRIRSMGASLDEVMPEIRQLWILTGVYGLLAGLGIRSVLHAVGKRESSESE